MGSYREQLTTEGINLETLTVNKTVKHTHTLVRVSVSLPVEVGCTLKKKKVYVKVYEVNRVIDLKLVTAVQIKGK